MFYSKIFLSLFVFSFNLITVSNANGRDILVKKETRPAWVIEKKSEININNLSGDTFGGYYYLLVDIQENIPKETIFCHYAIKLLNNDGVQNMSDINIDFNPDYQVLKFHEINRFRDGIKKDEMLNHEIKVIQREPDMERFLYDGSLTAFVNLEDIREGDIIEYSYTIQGYNPVYKGNYFKSIYLEYRDPVKEIYWRIITPANKHLYFNYPSGKVEPIVNQADNYKEYIWQNKDVNRLIYDNNVPSWYNSNLRVEISSFDNWGDVTRLILNNYQVSEKDLAGLKKMADELFAEKDKDSLLISIIHFVQDKIRYLAFESGLNAYKPISPYKVIETRFGDCKAKSLLLCSLLKLYDIEADPVFVNSNQIKSENQVSPSIDIFNHCVVRINYKNKVFYIDPTISNQGGSIDNYYFPAFGYGLVLKAGTDSLTLLNNNSSSEIRVQNYFKMDEIGGSASYKVITEYSGYYADDQRTSFQGKSLDEVIKNYLKFYSKTYPLIRSAAPVKYIDNRDKNLFRVEEEYLIDSMWIPSDGNDQKLSLNVGALVINSVVSVPSSPGRTMPYLISYPINYHEDIYLDLPEEWAVSPKNIEINDSIFYFSYNSAYKDKQVHLQYKYITKTDYLSPNSFNEYYSKHQKISDYLFYSLTYDKKAAKPFKICWLAVCCYFIILIISIYYAIQLYFKFNLKTNNSGDREIGGWLILIAFGLIISTIRVSYQFFFERTYFNQNIWLYFLQTSDRNIPMFVIVAFEFIYNSVLIVYLVFIQILFYKRRNTLPRLIIIFYSVNLIFLTLDTILAYTFSPDSLTLEEKNKSYIEIGRTLIYSVIWIAYFLNSRRVKATFTKVKEVRKESSLASAPSLR